jgi:hypothetical protein
MTAVATAVAVLRVVAEATRAAALVVAVRVQVLAKRRLRPSSHALLDRLQIVSALAPVVQPTARNSGKTLNSTSFCDTIVYRYSEAIAKGDLR